MSEHASDPHERGDVLGHVYLNGEAIGHFRWLELVTENGHRYVAAASDSAAAEAVIAATARRSESNDE